MAFGKKSGGFVKRSFGARSPRASGPRKPFVAHEASERFKATCSECHAVCEVPFRPNGKKPVYCRNCFNGKEDAPVGSATSGYRREASAPTDLVRQFDMLNFKLDRLIKAVEGRSRA